MPPPSSLLPRLLELLILTGGYWLADFAIRREGIPRGAAWLFARARLPARLAPALWLIPCLASAPFWGWDRIPQDGALRFLAGVLATALAWQAATRDFDLVSGERFVPGRVLAMLAAVLAWISPAGAMAAALLCTTPFGLWQHHATLPMRLLQAIAAAAGLAALSGLPEPAGLFRDAATPVFFLATMIASHYWITALAKGYLGPRPWSWVTDNRMHHLAASAWSWGWARFIPWERWRLLIRAVRGGERPLQAAAFAIELAAPLALLHPHAAIALCLAWAVFHLGVFALSGLLFWDWILADLAFAAVVWILPEPVAHAAFGPWQALAAALFMLIFPMRHKLWKPMPLGWFDTPLTQRMHWRVTGESGTVYGLYNDFMCPHERLYGKVHGCFLAPVPVMTYHLGEVWKPEVRDAIRESGGDPLKLDSVRDRFGIRPACGRRAAHHRACLEKFLAALNGGARKHALPRAFRWLKAPGDQIFYWGELPAFRGQERARSVSVIYREEFFDGEALRRVREDTVLEFDVPEVPSSAPLREPTPKEIDDFLLGHAAGRLIDLPGYGDGYVKGDDGRGAGVMSEE